MVTPHLPEGTLSVPPIQGWPRLPRFSLGREIRQPRESCHRRLKSGSSDKPGKVHLATVEVTKC
jgi:hypothetical protein